MNFDDLHNDPNRQHERRMNKILKPILALLIKIVFRIRIEGAQTGLSGEVLLIANRQTLLSGLLLALHFPIRVSFIVQSACCKGLLYQFVARATDSSFIIPSSPEAFSRIASLLENGRPLIVFMQECDPATEKWRQTVFSHAIKLANLLPVSMKRKRLNAVFQSVTLSLPSSLQSFSQAKPPVCKDENSLRELIRDLLCDARPRQTVFQAFLESMSNNGRTTRLLEDKNNIEYTYAELLKSMMALGRLAGKLAAPGEMVGVLMPNVATTINLFFGLNMAGRTPAMLNYTAGAAGVNSACIAAGISLVLSSRTFVEQARLEDLIGALENVHLVYLEDLRPQFSWRDKLWLILWATRFPSLACASSNEEDAAVVLFTSGSEGRPKGVVLSHRALLANVHQIRMIIDINPSDKVFNALPVFHSFGLTGGALLPVLTGTRLYLYTSPLHYKIIPGIICEKKCTVLFGTSTFLANYARHAESHEFKSLRYVVAGAEKLREEVRQVWKDRFAIHILEGYGVTECAPVISVNTPSASLPGSVGQLLPGMESRLVPIQGIAHGGRLHVRGPNLMKGYLRFEQPGMIQPPYSDLLGTGWFDTGDVAEIDRHGFLFIKGRVKRFAKVAGEMVSLEQTENIAQIAAPMAQVAATSIEDKQRGEAIILFATQAIDRETMQKAAREIGAPEIALPRKIMEIPEIPLLGSGKTDYTELRKLAEEMVSTH